MTKNDLFVKGVHKTYDMLQERLSELNPTDSQYIEGKVDGIKFALELLAIDLMENL